MKKYCPRRKAVSILGASLVRGFSQQSRQEAGRKTLATSALGDRRGALRRSSAVALVLAALAPSQARAEWITLLSPFRPCLVDCAVSVFAGQLVKTPMYEIFVTKHQMPWEWDFRSSTFVGAAFSREVVRFEHYAAIETEVGVGKRFGILDEGEVWGALYFRWKAFPWDEYLRTTIAVSTGLNYATDVPVFEKLRTKGPGNQLLHYLSPELTLGLPAYPNVDLILRFHHRSGGNLAFFNNTGGGAQYGTAGLRVRF